MATSAGRLATEHEIKAAFLRNFIRFVEWPASNADPPATFQICILGADPFQELLDNLVAGESVGGRSIAVRRVRRWDPPCDLLFVAGSEHDVFRTLQRVGPGVLTVGEHAGFLGEGGMINFVVEDRRVRFDVNRRAGEQAGLRFSSQLLAVARAVTP